MMPFMVSIVSITDEQRSTVAERLGIPVEEVSRRVEAYHAGTEDETIRAEFARLGVHLYRLVSPRTP